MPGGSGRASLRFAITDDAGHDQVGIVHGSSKGGRQGVTQFPALVNSSWNTRIEVAGESTWPGKAPHKFFNPGPVKRQVWIVIVERAFQVEICEVCRCAMPWSRNQKHIDVIALYEVVKVRVDQVNTRTRAPVA